MLLKREFSGPRTHKLCMTILIPSKAHMEQVLAQAKVKITPASKIWDAQRAYEKRLATAMSKDKGNHSPSRICARSADLLPAFAPAKGRRGKRKDAGASSGGEEVESEPEPPAPKKPRPEPQRKSRRLARESEPVVSSDHEGMETDTHSDKLTDLEDEEEKTEKEDDEEIEQDKPETPKARGKTESSRNNGAPQTTSSPSPSRKRARVGEEDVEDVEMEDIEPELSPAPEQTQESVVEEVVVRRKRLRA